MRDEFARYGDADGDHAGGGDCQGVDGEDQPGSGGFAWDGGGEAGGEVLPGSWAGSLARLRLLMSLGFLCVVDLALHSSWSIHGLLGFTVK